MQASLPMYDLPELADATAAWWDGIARHAGMAAPLVQPDDLLEHWRSPDLLFTQTCGYPLTHALEGQVRYLATPCYAAEGCAGPFYRSAVLVRAESGIQDFAEAQGACLAINGHDSQSGCNVLRVMAAEASDVRPFFGEIRRTGSHVSSVAAVQDGSADLAAVDCVTLGLLRSVRPGATRGLRVLAWSPKAPGLPYVTRKDLPDAEHRALLRGLRTAASDPRLAAARRRLLIHGIAVLDVSAYAVIPGMRRRAEALGLIELDPPA
ncbi:phosphate/phosphite/phosphonate ABC transporter substrate-binding protein [Geminicoccus roseus]|uniref:phosphate/phosphite/phosphonate ABC transporter substrate-binding protein n=1 Tax=Geminicoccus roseus TaxID=404900 RepID=UPI00068674AE|nr:PhnD/SsuA/transferrin family substrate-binding protein [Geminicoccus roseus]